MVPKTRIRRNSDILAAEVADEVVLLDPATWTYILCNETAARIWAVLDEPRAVDEVVETLVRDYDVDRTTCEREAVDFVSEMSGRGVIIVEPAA